MNQISGIKTREDALAAIDAIPSPAITAPPAALKEDATDSQKSAYISAVAEVNRRNGFAERETVMIAAIKEFVKGRVNAVAPDVKVIGLEVRADTGDIELISIRIISHK